MMGRLVVLLMVFVLARPALAQDGFPEFDFSGFIDFRAAATDDAVGWLDEGLGKVRYGAGRTGDKRMVGRVAQAAVMARARLSWTLEGFVHLQYDKDQRNAVDVVEAFLAYDPAPTSRLSWRARAGVFFPPFSLENEGIGWTSPYTITPSAINTWVGEELRTVGAEASLLYNTRNHRLSLTGAVYGFNDVAGGVLAWRGWALHDRITPVFDRLDLPPELDAFDPSLLFGLQAPFVKPFLEIDDRPGFYLQGKWESFDWGQLQLSYYDNRGRVPGYSRTQYSWDTRFGHAGLKLYLPFDMAFLAQGMVGETIMTIGFGRPEYVDNDFRAAYALISKRIDGHRLSIRYDRFAVDDDDMSGVDNNHERGHAWTVAYTTTVADHHRLGVELLHVESDRPERAAIGLSPEEVETLIQLQYRFQF